MSPLIFLLSTGLAAGKLVSIRSQSLPLPHHSSCSCREPAWACSAFNPFRKACLCGKGKVLYLIHWKAGFKKIKREEEEIVLITGRTCTCKCSFPWGNLHVLNKESPSQKYTFSSSLKQCSCPETVQKSGLWMCSRPGPKFLFLKERTLWSVLQCSKGTLPSIRNMQYSKMFASTAIYLNHSLSRLDTFYKLFSNAEHFQSDNKNWS